MILRTLQLADDEALEAATWYDERRPGLGDDFLDAYAAALEVIESHPRRYARLETTRSPREFRRYLLRRFPYAIIYEILADELVVLAVAHSSRRPNFWRRRT